MTYVLVKILDFVLPIKQNT